MLALVLWRVRQFISSTHPPLLYVRVYVARENPRAVAAASWVQGAGPCCTAVRELTRSPWPPPMWHFSHPSREGHYTVRAKLGERMELAGSDQGFWSSAPQGGQQFCLFPLVLLWLLLKAALTPLYWRSRPAYCFPATLKCSHYGTQSSSGHKPTSSRCSLNVPKLKPSHESHHGLELLG